MQDPTPHRDPLRRRSFRVQKISQDLTGDPNVLLAGETLRYTITVKNIGNANAVGRDDAGSRSRSTRRTSRAARRLNGTPRGRRGGHVCRSWLACRSMRRKTRRRAPCVPMHRPRRATSRRSRSTSVVDPDVIDGTVISNQAFVSATDANVMDYSIRRSRHADRERSDARHRGLSTADLRRTSARRCRSISGTARHRRSG